MPLDVSVVAPVPPDPTPRVDELSTPKASLWTTPAPRPENVIVPELVMPVAPEIAPRLDMSRVLESNWKVPVALPIWVLAVPVVLMVVAPVIDVVPDIEAPPLATVSPVKPERVPVIVELPVTVIPPVVTVKPVPAVMVVPATNALSVLSVVAALRYKLVSVPK